MTDSGYELLCRAIVLQAVKDYRAALRGGNEGAISDLSKWFRSEWGDRLCCGKGDYIATKIEKEEIERAEKSRVHRRAYHRCS